MNTRIAALVLGLSAGLLAMNAAEAAKVRTLTLTWDASAQAVTGYEVYYGKTAQQARMRLLAAPRTLNLKAPTVQFNVLRDLRALPGQTLCFRVKAYDNTTKSAFSSPVCTKV